MAKSDKSIQSEDWRASAEDLGEDVAVLAQIALERGRASMVRNVHGVTVRVTVEAA